MVSTRRKVFARRRKNCSGIRECVSTRSRLVPEYCERTTKRWRLRPMYLADNRGMGRRIVAIRNISLFLLLWGTNWYLAANGIIRRDTVAMASSSRLHCVVALAAGWLFGGLAACIRSVNGCRSVAPGALAAALALCLCSIRSGLCRRFTPAGMLCPHRLLLVLQLAPLLTCAKGLGLPQSFLPPTTLRNQ